jgi:excisionase family DNA binding protein
MLRVATADHAVNPPPKEESLMADQMTVSPTEPLWDVKQTASFFKASKSWVYKQHEKGSLPAIRLGGLLRFRPEDVRSFLVAHGKRRRMP